MSGAARLRQKAPSTLRALSRRLEARCAQYVETLRLRRIVPDPELEAGRPGGAENADTSVWGWIKWYGDLRVFLARMRKVEREARSMEQRQAILDALADTPEPVALLAKDATGAPRQVQVYAKGNVALVEMHNRNRVLARLVDDAEVLRTSQDPADMELHARALEEMQYLQRLLCWVATTPGARLPYPERTPRPDLPEEWADATALDYYAIAEAFARVNVLRLAALQDASTPEKVPDWSVFFAAVAGEMHVPAATLMRDWSLASVLASAAERGRAHEEARKRAEADRNARGGA